MHHRTISLSSLLKDMPLNPQQQDSQSASTQICDVKHYHFTFPDQDFFHLSTQTLMNGRNDSIKFLSFEVLEVSMMDHNLLSELFTNLS